MSPFLSVIIPVYNSEKFIMKALESLSKQTFYNFEIICVDDGSTDGSLKLLKSYAQKEPRLKVLHQENAGISCARNKGLSVAKGTYVTFLDHDDYVSVDFYQGLCEVAEKTGANVVANNRIATYYPDTRETKWPRPARILKGCFDLTARVVDKKIGHIYVWNKIFKTSFIQKNQIIFPPDRTYCEDMNFCMKVYYTAGKMYFTDKGTYHRQRVSTSASASYLKYAERMDYLLCAQRLLDFLFEHNLDRTYCPPITLLKQQVRFTNYDPDVVQAVKEFFQKAHIPFRLIPWKDMVFYIKYRWLK